MSDEELAKRAKACKGWRWMPGMLALNGWRVVDPGRLLTAQKQSAPPPAWQNGTSIEWLSGPLALPDLTDPATLGCLLALVREAWAQARVVVYHQHGQPSWEIDVELPDGSMPCVESAATEGEVLVAALEAAERREVSDE